MSTETIKEKMEGKVGDLSVAANEFAERQRKRSWFASGSGEMFILFFLFAVVCMFIGAAILATYQDSVHKKGYTRQCRAMQDIVDFAQSAMLYACKP